MRVMLSVLWKGTDHLGSAWGRNVCGSVSNREGVRCITVSQQKIKHRKSVNMLLK